MDIIALIIVELILLGILAKQIQDYRKYQRDIEDMHIILMKINDDIKQMTRSLK